MPRYRYQCEKCDVIATIFHTLDEETTDCSACGAKGTLNKLLSTPFIKKSTNHDKQEQKVGEITKKYIEDNREILKNQKKEAKSKSHDKT